MKRILVNIIVWILFVSVASIPLYLLGCFISLDFNIVNWSQGLRGGFAIIELFIMIFLAIIIGTE